MDSRETNHKWYESFDEKSMTFHVSIGYGEEELEIPAKYEVCGVCDGKGKHVNPSIDSNGLSAEDFAEDPDFAEDYFSGTYDVPCNCCHGSRVEPVVDRERMKPEELERIDKIIQEHYDYQHECWMERKMGC